MTRPTLHSGLHLIDGRRVQLPPIPNKAPACSFIAVASKISGGRTFSQVAGSPRRPRSPFPGRTRQWSMRVAGGADPSGGLEPQGYSCPGKFARGSSRKCWKNGISVVSAFSRVLASLAVPMGSEVIFLTQFCVIEGR